MVILSAGNFLTPGVAQDLYAVIGVERNAPRAVIKRAIHRQRARLNPELPANKGEDSFVDAYEDVIRAEEVLLDAQRK